MSVHRGYLCNFEAKNNYGPFDYKTQKACALRHTQSRYCYGLLDLKVESEGFLWVSRLAVGYYAYFLNNVSETALETIKLTLFTVLESNFFFLATQIKTREEKKCRKSRLTSNVSGINCKIWPLPVDVSQHVCVLCISSMLGNACSAQSFSFKLLFLAAGQRYAL